MHLRLHEPGKEVLKMRSYKEMEINYHERQKEERKKQKDEQIKINMECLAIDRLVSGLIMNDEAELDYDILLNGNAIMYEIRGDDPYIHSFYFLSCFNYGMAIYDVNHFIMYVIKPFDEMDAVEKRYYNEFERKVMGRVMYDDEDVVKYKVARRI